MEHYEVTTFNVGQGMFNLVRVLSENGRCQFRGIFDCGTVSNTKVDKDQLLTNAAAKINGGVDCIVISHQDRDHWSYLEELLKRAFYFDFKPNVWYKSRKANGAFCRTNDTEGGLIREMYSNAYGVTGFNCIYIEKDGKTVKISRYMDKKYMGCEWTIIGNAEEKEDFRITIHADFIDEVFYYDKVKTYSFYDRSRFEKYLDQSDVDNIIKDVLKDIYGNEENDWGYVYNIINILFDRAHQNIDVEVQNAQYISDKSIPNIYVGGMCWKPKFYELSVILSALGDLSVLEQTYLGIKKEAFFNFKLSIDENVSSNNSQGYDIKIKRNATSLIASFIDWRETIQFLFPGDATIHTFGSLYNAFKKNYDPVYMTAPHHGSYDTNILLDNDGREVEDDEQPVKLFFKEYKPETVVISAYHKKYGHPHEKVAEFMDYNAEACNPHDILVCTRPGKNPPTKNFTCKNRLFSTESNGDIIWYDGKITVQKGFEAKARMDFLPSDDLFIRIDGVRL